MRQMTFLAVGLIVGTCGTRALTYDVDLTGISAPVGSQFTATGGSLEIKNHNGYKGLGVSGGASGAEIDLGQKLAVDFQVPQYLQDITLAFLYDGPEYSDGNEIAAIRINGVEYTLTATGSTSSSWTGSGSVQNLSPATGEGGAVWKISNPVGATLVSSIEFYPLVYPVGHEAPNPSDFSLRAFNTSNVPDGGASSALLALGCIGLGALSARRSKP